jgi:hypothetical protein
VEWGVAIYVPFGWNKLHQPFGLISPSTALQALGG